MSLNVATFARPLWKDGLVCEYLAKGKPCECYKDYPGVYHRFGWLMEYMHFFLVRSVEYARARGLSVADFDSMCTRDQLKADFDARNPILFVHGAHGAENVLTSDDAPGLEGKMIYLLCSPGKRSCPSPNHEWLSGRVTYTLSCLSASQLGPASVEANAKAYIGWKTPLYVMIVRSELPDIVSWDEANWDACMAGIFTLLDGGTTEEARTASYERFNYWYDYYGDPAHEDPYGIWQTTRWVLLTDRDGMVLHGAGDAVVRPVVPVTPMPFIQFPFVAGLLVTMAGLYPPKR